MYLRGGGIFLLMVMRRRWKLVSRATFGSDEALEIERSESGSCSSVGEFGSKRA